MKPPANPRVLKRFIVMMSIATFVLFSVWAVVTQYLETPEGDYETRQGDILMGDGKYEEALERFTAALKAMPDHRGALMGRAISYLQLEQYREAEAEFTYLIEYLKKNVEPDDLTGIGVLAAAFANRGILYDRTARYERALSDYIDALKIDEEITEGPGIVDKILYGTPQPATVRKRAIYIKQQLELPESQRLLRVPELDDKERMYKP